jgi:hypothetical protein
LRERERERERDWRQSGRICNATGYLLQWKTNSKTISHFCGLFGWQLGQLRFYKIFKNKHSFTLIWKFGKFGWERKTREKRKREPGQPVECTLFFKKFQSFNI